MQLQILFMEQNEYKKEQIKQSLFLQQIHN